MDRSEFRPRVMISKPSEELHAQAMAPLIAANPQLGIDGTPRYVVIHERHKIAKVE